MGMKMKELTVNNKEWLGTPLAQRKLLLLEVDRSCLLRVPTLLFYAERSKSVSGNPLVFFV